MPKTSSMRQVANGFHNVYDLIMYRIKLQFVFCWTCNDIYTRVMNMVVIIYVIYI